jgi:8-oxo-dGTP pyrophosphatase MutT (NUDIX family)
MIKEKAGIVLIWENKILLVHSTSATWSKPTCGIPKGHIEPGEDSINTAIRELNEETGIQLNINQLNRDQHEVYIYSGKKITQILNYWVCTVKKLDEVGLSSPKIPKNQLQLSEIDWAKFVDPITAYSLIHESQRIIIDRHLSLR